MKALCQAGSDCDYDLYEKEFNVKSIGKGKCPNCGSSRIAPAWIKGYKLPGEEDLRLHIIKTGKKINNLERELKELEKLKEKNNGRK